MLGRNGAASGGDRAVAALSADAAGMSEFAGALKERISIERPPDLRTASGLQTAGWGWA